jgi:hypothetical protein
MLIKLSTFVLGLMMSASAGAQPIELWLGCGPESLRESTETGDLFYWARLLESDSRRAYTAAAEQSPTEAPRLYRKAALATERSIANLKRSWVASGGPQPPEDLRDHELAQAWAKVEDRSPEQVASPDRVPSTCRDVPTGNATALRQQAREEWLAFESQHERIMALQQPDRKALARVLAEPMGARLVRTANFLLSAGCSAGSAGDDDLIAASSCYAEAGRHLGGHLTRIQRYEASGDLSAKAAAIVSGIALARPSGRQ